MAKKNAKAGKAAGDAEAKNAATPPKQGQDKTDKGAAKASKSADTSGGQRSAGKKASQDKKGQAQQHEGVVGKVEQFKEFFEESKVELKKVTWPSRKETISTCIAVIALTIVMSLFLGVVDFGLSKIVAFILS